MQRYEITGTATDTFRREDIMSALRKAGAVRVNTRRAFGWRNQPRVATFAALDDYTAKAVASVAREYLNHPSSLPSLIPHRY